ncbi:PASTA domain-containing protein [Streptomyces sp. cmx-18-6]|uniref:PASTA domain-containing protein n=1 Tax=Streptomyces sp. cmx-18-6 TaxID=2790930 RepID=UPI00398180E9
MRIPRHLAPVALLSALALAGCSGGAPTDDSAPTPPPATTATATATPTATASAAPTASPTVTATETAAPTPPPSGGVTAAPDPVMPALHGKTYEEARQEFARRGISPARLTTAAQHKDVTLPRDHGSWYICATSPRPDAPLPAAAKVTVRLAADFSDCTTSFHGYLHQKNDPAHTPPATDR